MYTVQVINPNNDTCIGVPCIQPKKFKKKLILVGNNGLKIKATVSNYYNSDSDSASDSNSDSD